jgi:Spy/CpxP family protein refolding chaperone
MKSTKNMLIAALAAGALLAGSSALLAEDNSTPPPAGEHGPGMKGHGNIAKELNLTADQKPKFQEIMKNAMEQRKALHEDTSLSKEDRKAKMKTIQEATNKQLKDLLTADQYAKWQEMTKKARKGGAASHD